MILYIFKNWIYINLTNPFRTMNKLKGVFKPLKCYFRFGQPNKWYSKPALIHIVSQDVGWKDKYNSPRFEGCPYIWIHIWKLNLYWFWGLHQFQFSKDEDYWEQALWYLHYYGNTSYGSDKPDIRKARESWAWTIWNEKKNDWTDSWNDKFLIKND